VPAKIVKKIYVRGCAALWQMHRSLAGRLLPPAAPVSSQSTAQDDTSGGRWLPEGIRPGAVKSQGSLFSDHDPRRRAALKFPFSARGSVA